MRILILLAAMIAAVPALALPMLHQMQVTSEDGGDFTVQYHAQARLTDYWCAAGLYARRDHGLSDRARIYRQSPPPRGAGQGIRFTLDAAHSAGTTGITTFGGRQDGSMSVAVAVNSFCYDLDLPRF